MYFIFAGDFVCFIVHWGAVNYVFFTQRRGDSGDLKMLFCYLNNHENRKTVFLDKNCGLYI
jgi:hypothetical protein